MTVLAVKYQTYALYFDNNQKNKVIQVAPLSVPLSQKQWWCIISTTSTWLDENLSGRPLDSAVPPKRNCVHTIMLANENSTRDAAKRPQRRSHDLRAGGHCRTTLAPPQQSGNSAHDVSIVLTQNSRGFIVGLCVNLDGVIPFH